MSNNPYRDDQNKAPSPRYSQKEYRRSDAPFQFPIWLIILTFCLSMWPVAIGMLVLNSLLRSGKLTWSTASQMQRQARDARQQRHTATVRSTAAAGSSAATGRTAAQPAASAPRTASDTDKQAPVSADKNAENREKGLLIVGAVVGAAGLMATISGLHDMIFYGGWEYAYLYVEDVLAGMLPLFAGAGMCIGAHLLKTGRRMRRKIDNIVGDSDFMYIQDIAGAIPCRYDKCCRYLEDCIDRGLFGEDAYLDMRSRCLVVRGEAPKPDAAPHPEAEPAKAQAAEADPHEQSLLRLRALRGAISDPEMAQKIARLETVTEKIFTQARTDPDKRPQMRKFLDYYLPTVVKLLEAYAEMEAQGIEGDNIRESKHRIEDAMDTLVTAFENQLDKLFASDALDLSADIDVMEQMMRADGLTDSPFDLRVPQAPEAPKPDL